MKGILFKETLFNKVVNREKTVTRRIVKPQPDAGDYLVTPIAPKGEPYWQLGGCKYPYLADVQPKPRYKVGEQLFLKEPYQYYYICNGVDANEVYARFRLGYSKRVIDVDLRKYKSMDENLSWIKNRQNEQSKSKTGFCNKMFMPEFLAQYFIEITDVRCERLQEITSDDCLKEGIETSEQGKNTYYFSKSVQYSGCRVGICKIFETPQQAYAALIDKINGKGTWDSNPHVYRYEFKYIKK
jgi:hypothetical protein